jgi:type III restriction enzyme
MKLKFKQQSYQTEATDAIASIFAGQQKGHRKETVGRVGLFVDEVFSNKRIELSEEALLTNIQTVQKEQGLPVSLQARKPTCSKRRRGYSHCSKLDH